MTSPVVNKSPSFGENGVHRHGEEEEKDDDDDVLMEMKDEFLPLHKQVGQELEFTEKFHGRHIAPKCSTVSQTGAELLPGTEMFLLVWDGHFAMLLQYRLASRRQ